MNDKPAFDHEKQLITSERIVEGKAMLSKLVDRFDGSSSQLREEYPTAE